MSSITAGWPLGTEGPPKSPSSSAPRDMPAAPAGFFEDVPTPSRSSSESPPGAEELGPDEAGPEPPTDAFGIEPGPGERRSSKPAKPSTTGSARVTDDNRDDPDVFDLALSTALSRSVAQSPSPPLMFAELFSSPVLPAVPLANTSKASMSFGTEPDTGVMPRGDAVSDPLLVPNIAPRISSASPSACDPPWLRSPALPPLLLVAVAIMLGPF
mmetsp:Transcript_7123/g.31330  ORF Transcript_7123/g.31330 Transcript_7123/m.31330 type:complete len:213 (+) Transcript_7123:1684-2322(+)